jgi:hypothetical protein
VKGSRVGIIAQLEERIEASKDFYEMYALRKMARRYRSGSGEFGPWAVVRRFHEGQQLFTRHEVESLLALAEDACLTGSEWSLEACEMMRLALKYYRWGQALASALRAS